MVVADRPRKFCNLCALYWLMQTPNLIKLYYLVKNLRKSGWKQVSKSVLKVKQFIQKTVINEIRSVQTNYKM